MCVDTVRGLIRAIECDWKIDSLDIMEDLRVGLLEISGKRAEIYVRGYAICDTRSKSICNDVKRLGKALF